MVKIMCITLERILELIPKKENGDFQHGALKQFALKLGLKSGNLISDWIHGSSRSYENYIYQIASIYGVSVEWLRGETDIKEPFTAKNEELSDKSNLLISLFEQLNIEGQEKLLDYADDLVSSGKYKKHGASNMVQGKGA